MELKLGKASDIRDIWANHKKMIAQLGEVFRMENHHYMIAEQPLTPYLKNSLQSSFFHSPSEDCVRGYFGKWELIHERLFLTSLRGFTKTLDEVGLNDLFPEQHSVFAEWYNGLITLPQGDILFHRKGDQATLYEEELVLCFNQGELIGYETLCNRPQQEHLLFIE